MTDAELASAVRYMEQQGYRLVRVTICENPEST